MTIFGRFSIGVVASAALCGAAIALSADAAAAPLITGGIGCVQGMAGEAPAAAGGSPDAGVCTVAAPAPEAGGVPMAVPGPLPVGAPVPVAPVLPVVPIGTPLIVLAAVADWCSRGSGRSGH